MHAGVAIPALGPDGWIKESSKALDRLIAYAFESDRSQSHIYVGNIVSIPWIYTQNTGNPEEMASAIERELTGYLFRHFSKVEVYCKVKENLEPSNYVELTLIVRVEDDDGVAYDLNKIIKGNNTKILEIINYLNG